MITNKIGLEAEFFLRDATGSLVYPSLHGFQTDDFCILGEFRGEPGATRAEAISLFLKSYYDVIYRARRANLKVDVVGHATLTPALYAEILRKMGSKSVAACRNIHGTDILTLSDAETKDGKVVSQRASAGLHIHFSSEDVAVQSVTVPTLTAVKLPINIGPTAYLDVYTKTGETKQEITARASRITAPVIEQFVRRLDAEVLPDFMAGMPALKYRNAGFYETKPYGFEYRSLPFNQRALDQIDIIVDRAFGLLESL